MFNSKTDSIVSNSVSASINKRIEVEIKAKLNTSLKFIRLLRVVFFSQQVKTTRSNRMKFRLTEYIIAYSSFFSGTRLAAGGGTNFSRMELTKASKRK